MTDNENNPMHFADHGVAGGFPHRASDCAPLQEQRAARIAPPPDPEMLRRAREDREPRVWHPTLPVNVERVEQITAAIEQPYRSTDNLSPVHDRVCDSCGGPLAVCHAEECEDWIDEHIICLRSDVDEEDCDGIASADLAGLIDRLRAAALLTNGHVFQSLYREAADALVVLSPKVKP